MSKLSFYVHLKPNKMLFKPQCSSVFSFISLVLISIKVSDMDAARILAYFPIPSISHQIVFRSLTRELLRRGHEVTVITTDPAFPKGEAPENFTEIDIHDVSYKKFREIRLELAKTSNFISRLKLLTEMLTTILEVQLNDTNVQEVLHKDSDHYDLLLIEACVRPALVLSYLFNAPVILVSSLGATPANIDAMGLPTHPFLYPTMVRRRIYNLSIWEKIKGLTTEVFIKLIIDLYENYENEVLTRNFGLNVPTVQELSNNVDMLFLNVHPIWVENIPVPPSVVFMGGIHINPISKIPEDIDSYLNSSKNGVIYVSFGTNVKTNMIKPETRQKLIGVLSKVPYDVLWKWDSEELPGRTENIRISKWLPQADLLRHPKIKLFITQGGLQSIDEAISAGVPLIGIPMIADQPYNVEKIARFNIGLKLNTETFTEIELRNAVFTIIEDKSYRQNVAKLRCIMFDQPQPPLERAIWWTEHTLRHGGARHLRAPSANLPWTEYYELKLVAITLLGLVITIVVIMKVIKVLYRTWLTCGHVKMKIS